VISEARNIKNENQAYCVLAEEILKYFFKVFIFLEFLLLLAAS